MLETKTLKASSREVLEQHIEQSAEEYWFPYGDVKEEHGWYSIQVAKAPAIMEDTYKQLGISGKLAYKDMLNVKRIFGL